MPTDHRFLLGSDGRVRSDADFIFCNQPAAPDGSVQHTGKSPAGSTTSEAIDLALDTVAVDVDRNRRCGWPAGVLPAGAHCWASHLSKVISPQLGARTLHQRPLADPRPGVAGLLVGDHLARVALRREGLAHQLIQPELLRTADLTDPVQRLPTATRPTPLGPHGSGFPERDRPHARLPADFGYQGRTRPGCPAAALTDEFAAWTSSHVRGQGDEMAITRILAQMTVADLTVATQWYSRLFGREPDARPMEGLIEWHLADAFGVQVWAESDRAGRSTIVLDESDLDAFVQGLDHAGIPHPEPQNATTSRILLLEDPDGNRIVITGPLGGN